MWLVPDVVSNVRAQLAGITKFHATLKTVIQLFIFVVSQHVKFEVAEDAELAQALDALERLRLSVAEFVDFELVRLPESPITLITAVRLFAGMQRHVGLQRARSRKISFTQPTLILLFVSQQVLLQVVC